jgi:hypothetical protein
VVPIKSKSTSSESAGNVYQPNNHIIITPTFTTDVMYKLKFLCILTFFFSIVNCLSSSIGLLRLQEIYQRIKPGSNNILIEMVRRVENSREAIQFLQTLESIDRYGRKFVVLDCSASLASEIIIQHVKDVHLGRRNYHYLLSGLVRTHFIYPCDLNV